MNENLVAQLDKVQEEINKLRAMMTDTDEEKRNISMLVTGTPDLHIRNPELFEQMRPYADPDKPPFTTQTWQMVVMGMGDPRLTYEQLENFKSGQYSPTAPWDNLRVKK